MSKLAPKLVVLIFVSLLFPFCRHCAAEWKPCKQRKFDQDSFVCVCTSDYCDTLKPVGTLDGDQLVYFVSDPLAQRLARFELAPSDGANANAGGLIEVRINASEKRQRIFGFGGAFTDAAGINMQSLSESARDVLLKAYFDKEIGIGYTVGRVPIASCDFSAREYSYLDTKDDFNLSTFALAPEDIKFKIPNILRAIELVGEELRLFASPWSAPGWMKNTGKMIGWGFMKGPVVGKYYLTYAHYFRRFFEEYAQRSVQFWGLTIENEPGAGLFPFWTWQAMYMSATTQRQFAATVLAPTLKTSPASANVKIMAHDDQRNNVLEAAQKFYATSDGVHSIDGIAVHWYSHSDYDKLTKTHNLRPDKFILASEACTGYSPFEHKPLLGDWSRGRAYAHDILNDLRNWVVGWTDWNLCLDLQGGPNLVRNFVDSPIIVNASGSEFYKQPMFYAMAHFSRFVPPNSTVLGSTLFSENGIKLADKPLEKGNADQFLDMKNNRLSENPVEHIAFQTPNVLVLINPDRSARNVSVVDQLNGRRWTVPLGGDAIVTAVWKAQIYEKAF